MYMLRPKMYLGREGRKGVMEGRRDGGREEGKEKLSAAYNKK